MCGILCILSNNNNEEWELEDNLSIFKKTIIRRGPDSFEIKKHKINDKTSILLAASVLWLQGKSVTKQPIENDRTIFVYNGDIFGGIPEDLRNQFGDTFLLHDLLQNANSIPVALSQVQGPYAFVYLDKKQNLLYFGRDTYGRRSLLLGLNKAGRIFLTSSAKRLCDHTFMELPCIGTFGLDLESGELMLYPWKYRNKNFEKQLTELQIFSGKHIRIEQILDLQECKQFTYPSNGDLEILQRLRGIPIEKAYEIIFNTPEWLQRILKLKELLEEAVRLRISLMPQKCRACFHENLNNCNHALVGILFSGGIDCSLLALIADKFIDKTRPIELMNVAFDETNNYQTPDRITGIKSWEELKKLCPQREWLFNEVNVTHHELDKERREIIADLIYPLNTILDDSLGCAMWFASRGKTSVVNPSCKVLLVGMGADELFGGYTKHRAAFKKNNWHGLDNILNEDWQNLPHRNLARDDRVVSDHGRQLRTPYLDENVVEYVRNLNCWERTYPSDDLLHGFGDKILLRSLAFHYGLTNVCTFKKRALQFGSRIANKKENANEVSSRLLVNKDDMNYFDVFCFPF